MNSMKQGLHGCSAGQENFLLLFNTKVYCCVHKITPLDPFLKKLNPVHTRLPYFSKIHFKIIVPFTLRSAFFFYL